MEDELQASQYRRRLVCDVRGSRRAVPDAKGGEVQVLVYLPGREGLHDTGGAGNTQFRPGCERRGEKGMAATKAVSDNDSDRKRAEWGQDRGVETHGNQKAWSTEVGRASGCTLPPALQWHTLFSFLDSYAEMVLEILLNQ